MKGPTKMRSDLLFSEMDGFSVFRNQKDALSKAIATAPESMASWPDDEVVAKYVSQFDVEVPSLIRDQMTQSEREIDVDISHYPGRFIIDRNRPFLVKGTEIKVHIPFTGEGIFFKVQPNMFSTSMPRGTVVGQELIIKFTFPNDQPPTDLKRALDGQLAEIEQYLQRLREMANQLRTEMPPVARQSWQERKKQFSTRSGVVAALGLPKRMTAAQPTQPMPAKASTPQVEQSAPSRRKITQDVEWDAFISHASEDKFDFVKDLAAALSASGLRVWYDEETLTVGDRLRRKIDEGLSKSRYGIVVLSPSFFAKHWPQQELDGLAAREVNGVKVILPIWHNISHSEVAAYSPTLADRLAVSSSRGLPTVVDELLRAMKAK